MKVLVTGGAGYIGAITVKLLQEKGFEVVVFDNLKQGYKESVSCELIVGDLRNKKDLELLGNRNFDAVIHFAALALAGESMQKPYDYLENNILGGINLLEFMKEEGIKNIVFSSTCAIYGYPKKLPVSEDEEKNPESVYGESKLTLEKILYWYDQIYGVKHINLRYFNAAGASLDGTLGEHHDPETHIIPNAIKAILGDYEFELFGNNYETPDGTTIRDYIHVLDLAEAHVLAFSKLKETGKSDIFNLGTGKGYSNMEVLKMVEKVSGKNLKIKISPRRPGDPDQIYADSTKAKKGLGFSPKFSDLETIISSAFKWHERNSKLKNQNSK